MTFELNEAQEIVASALHGRVLVSAGAGTGKTRALTERFVRAVKPVCTGEAPRAEVDEVLTITFTEKAAGEIAERIRKELKAGGCPEQVEGLGGAWISTIHGFGRRLLRRHALEAGLDPMFSIADEVSGGFLRDEALERTLKTALDRCEQGPSILEMYSPADIGKAVRCVAQELRTRGLGVEGLITEPLADPRMLLSEAIAVLEEATAAFSPHVGEKNKGATDNHEACVSAVSELSEVDASGTGSAEIALAVWRAMAVGWPPAARAKALSECAGALSEARERLTRAAAAHIVEPYLGHFREMVAEYLSCMEELKRQRGALDFDDLQLRAYDLLRTNEALRDRYRRELVLVMVDEFQDTDAVQSSLVEMVAGEDLCTVGDERQSIYAFRGADVEVYRRHRAEMRRADAVEVDLVENYRSHPDIIAFVNRLFESHEFFGPELPALVASRHEPEDPYVAVESPRVRVELVRTDKEKREQTLAAEAEAIAGHFADLREHGRSPEDMVVLVRQYRTATPIAAALQRYGFDVEVVGGSRFFGLRETAILRDVCAVIANPYDDLALARLLISELGALSDEGALLLSAARRSEGSTDPLWDALGRAETVLEGHDLSAARQLRGVLEAATGRAAQGDLAQAVAGAVEDSGLDLLYAASGRAGEQAFENVQKFLRKIEAFERSGESGAAAFVARLEAEERFGSTESPARVVSHGASAVRIMSIHASKGLEFPVVAVAACADAPRSSGGTVRTGAFQNGLRVALRMPKSLSDEGKSGYEATEWYGDLGDRALSSQIAEMKRQFYVACTRAQEVLVLSGTVDRKKSPEEAGECPLSWCRRALTALRDTPEDEREIREFEPGRFLAISARDVVAGEFEEGGEELASGGEAGPARSTDIPGYGGAALMTSAPRNLADGVEPVRPERLSATDIGLHQRCTLRYWAERVARLGEAPEVVVGRDDPLAFGSALHAVLQLDGELTTGVPPERHEAIVRYHRLETSALPRLERAIEAWRGSPTRRELHEYELVRTEYPFRLGVPGGGASRFDLVGAIDAWGRSGESALVVDYKSGSSAADEPELRERYALQASVYAYAVLREGCRGVTVRFVRPEVVAADGQMQHVDIAFEAEDMQRLEQQFETAYERIASEPYRPLTRWDPQTCGTCRIAGRICPLTPPGRGAG